MVIVAINDCYAHRRPAQCLRGQETTEARAYNDHVWQGFMRSLRCRFSPVRLDILRCHRLFAFYILHIDSSQDTPSLIQYH